MTTTGTIIEEGEITFSGVANETHNFSSSFTSSPSVKVSVSSGGSQEFVVNAVVTAVSSTSFSVTTSSSFFGSVQFRAVGS